VLLDALPDPNKALQAILRANEVAVREDARGEIQATAESTKADVRPYRLSEIEAFHDDLLATAALLILPPKALLERPDLGWTRTTIGWADPELGIVTRERPEDGSRAYGIKTLIEIVVEESSR
jgi:hypothetical protein